jgi:hypothetical protein
MRDVPRRAFHASVHFPRLDDLAFLRIEVALGHPSAVIAEQVGCSKEAVLAATRRHGIKWPTRGVSRLDRVKALRDPVERKIAADMLVAEMEAELAEARKLRKTAGRRVRSRS